MSCDLSIIIPAYNEAHLIARGLSSIATYLRSISYEILVVDNGSTDDTAGTAAAHANVRVLSIPKTTIGRARNIGAAAACGTLFAFLDADVMITARWASAIEQKLTIAKQGRPYFGGFPFDIPPHQASLIERAWFVASSVGRPSYVGSANLIVSATVFRHVNGFDESLRTAEDVDIGHRIRDLGHAIDFDPNLHVIHLGFPRTLRHFVKRERWHGLGSFRDLPTFRRSKVSIAAALLGATLVAAMLLVVFAQPRAALVVLGAHLALPALYVIYRFRFRNSRYLAIQYVLGYAYLAARAAAGISVLCGLSATGHRSS